MRVVLVPCLALALVFVSLGCGGEVADVDNPNTYEKDALRSARP